jgi:hypothetical protein
MAKRRSFARKSATSSRKRSSGSRAGSRRRGTAKSATANAKRTARGQFREMDEKGRSLKGDRRVKAETRAKPGYGDRGDRAA